MASASVCTLLTELCCVHCEPRLQSESGVYDMTVLPSAYWMLSGNVYCLGLASVPGISIVMGDVVMENYYFVHDKTSRRVGVAPRSSAAC